MPQRAQRATEKKREKILKKGNRLRRVLITIMKNFIIFLVFVAGCGVVCAESASKAVEAGNRLYGEQKFQEAGVEYDRAAEFKGGSLVPRFNKANSLYRLGDVSAAADLYSEVAARSKDEGLVAAAKYNLGNSNFRLAAEKMGAQKPDVDGAIADYKDAVKSFRQVLDIEPDNEKAGRNIEVAKQVIRKLLQQKKQMEEQKKEQQKKQQDAKDKLEDVKEKQKKLSQENQKTQEKQEKGEISKQQAQQEHKEQQKKQEELNEETKQAADQVKEAFGGQDQKDDNGQPQAEKSGADKAMEDIEDAMKDQKKAADELGAGAGKKAKESQDGAVEKLEKAIEELSKGDEKKKDGEGDEKKKDDEKKNGEKDDKNKGEQEQPKDDEQDGKQDQEQEAPDATAEEILNKEKQNKKRRRVIGVYKVPVEKDW